MGLRNVAEGESRRVDGRQAGRVHLDDPAGDGPVGRLVGDRRLDDEDGLPGGVDPEAGELAEAERRGPQRVEHQQVRAPDLHDGRRPLIVMPASAVPGLVLDPAPIMQRADHAANGHRIAVEPIDPPANGPLEPTPGPARTPRAPPPGRSSTTTAPPAPWRSNSASRTVPSPAEPPPTLSPRSTRTTGRRSDARASRTASSGPGQATNSSCRASHIASASSSATACADGAVAVGHGDHRRAHLRARRRRGSRPSG